MTYRSYSTSCLFLALWPDIATQKAIQKLCNQYTWPPGASLVVRESLHLTLHFLGNVPDFRLPELTQKLRVPVRPFELHFRDVQRWPHGVVVVKSDAVPDDLLELHASLGAALQHLGVPTKERSYHPHITLARHVSSAVC